MEKTDLWRLYQFVAYFLPTEETMEKRAKDFTEGKEYDDEQVKFSSASKRQLISPTRWQDCRHCVNLIK